MSKKQNLGQFNTRNGVWLRPHIIEFIGDAGCWDVVDPFVGRGDLFSGLWQIFDHYIGYDIDPDLCTEMGWTWNDSLEDVPFHPNAMVVTNPPYLAKNSAARNGLESYDYFKDPENERYEDLYQIALEKVLTKYKKAVFIIPETYFQTDFFKQHLEVYSVIEENPFTDTDCPICVACFSVNRDFMRIAGNNYDIYKNDEFLFTKHELEDRLWDFNSCRYGDIAWSTPQRPMIFNAAEGNLGLRGVDGISPFDKIRFCKPEDLHYNLDEVSETSRSITVIDVAGVEITDDFITLANKYLKRLREQTHDVILSPFKNNNKLGKRRRRLDYKWARKIIEKTMETLDK